ncbi:hypothetical protein [Candidatus Nitrosotalea okcheonensis]|uniref:Uncharacterized protein n=1 Tax=Candidatus Nitrosotalea okcheonensis TaxID=1903276 RepID=A0A2H1FFW6_9ARCH|nr:hypothetical protein [Candidatus Nitrosotalea okcheonensis]SMH71647.1 conserved protein of unknown function [Candidatus Nitrosotalea okcheonensis]
MTSPNYAGNIIVNLAGLPEFLRKPILHKRLAEFFSMTQEDQKEIINNALQAGPTIQFDKFSILFKTWLEILCNLSEEQRIIMFSRYINEITSHPEKLIVFNLDGIFEIYMSLSVDQRSILSATIKKIIKTFDEKDRKKLYMIIPEMVKNEMDI